MASSNSFVFFMVLLVITFVMYKAASGHPNLIENWGWTMVSMNSNVNSVQNGASKPGNNQQQLFYNTNQFINTNLLNPAQTSIVSQSLNPSIGASQVSAGSARKEVKTNPALQAASMYENYQSNPANTTSLGGEPVAGFPVYTVPGTYQADLSPRFNSQGLNSFVKYNLPAEENLASYAKDPLTMAAPSTEGYCGAGRCGMASGPSTSETYAPMDLANKVEKPMVREDYKSIESTTSADQAKMRQKLAEMGAKVADKLPVQPMSGGQPNDKEPIFYNADRYIFALQKSKLYGRADFIRGDIPIVPTLPNSDTSSNVWFRPSVIPRTDLNAGALGVIGGGYNTTQQQLLELMARSAGGSQPVINGITAEPVNTAVNTLNNSQLSRLSSVSQSNEISQKVNSVNPPNLVRTSAFA
jgi:hypothetical protein